MTTTAGAIKIRPTGAKAEIGRSGRAHVTSVTGGEIEIVTALSEPGFNPLDLLYSSLAACLVLSARIAAGRLGVLDQLDTVTVDVHGDKAQGDPSRVETLHIAIAIRGAFDEATRDALMHEAEAICTISNTLKVAPTFEVSVAA
ncbi:OsmC family protein [Rhizobium sp. YIM 134829]|uniref:OsmC family protein n=1 Tax=Rhizobium sp. YIM 134829 TaxID=3390453 RepID=UPI0039796BAB